VYVTGFLELLGALGLALHQFQRLAGICLILLLAAMFVANINAARTGVTLGGRPATPVWIRTPMQIHCCPKQRGVAVRFGESKGLEVAEMSFPEGGLLFC
jgi:uncharacterized membrane protein